VQAGAEHRDVDHLRQDASAAVAAARSAVVISTSAPGRSFADRRGTAVDQHAALMQEQDRVQRSASSR